MAPGGVEPPTNGFEVDARGLAVPREGWPSRMVERLRLALPRRLWGAVVDPPLTAQGRPGPAFEAPFLANRADLGIRDSS